MLIYAQYIFSLRLRNVLLSASLPNWMPLVYYIIFAPVTSPSPHDRHQPYCPSSEKLKHVRHYRIYDHDITPPPQKNVLSSSNNPTKARGHSFSHCAIGISERNCSTRNPIFIMNLVNTHVIGFAWAPVALLCLVAFINAGLVDPQTSRSWIRI